MTQKIHAFVIFATLLATSSAWSFESAVCRSFLESQENLSRSLTPDVRNDWNALWNVMEGVSERNVGNWYFANIVAPKEGVYGSALVASGEAANAALRARLGSKVSDAKKFYSRHVLRGDGDVVGFVKALRPFHRGDLPADLGARIQEMSARIAASPRGDVPLDAVLDFVLTLRGQIGDGFASIAIYHRFLAEMGYLPSLHGISRATDPAVFKSEMRDRIILGALLRDDIASRVRLDLRIKSSPVVFLADVPKKIEIKSTAKKRTATIDFDLMGFSNFLRDRKYAGITDLKVAVDDFVASFQKWSVEFVKKGDDAADKFVLNRIPEDFIDNFFETTLTDPKKWKAKIRAFYDTEEMLYRGQFLRKYLKDREVMKFFTSIDQSMVSMRSKIGAGIINQPFVTRDFRTFNALFDTDKESLLKYVSDHMTEGERYLKSPFLSSSKNERTAMRFAKGFLRKPEEVAGMKSQIVYSYYRTNGFGEIDVNRLNSMLKANESPLTFSSQYGRQEEVMNVGALSPDTVMEVRVIDVEDIAIQQVMDQNIAEAKVLRERVFKRSFDDPSLIRVEETVDGVVTSREYRARRNFFGLILFDEVKR